MYVYVCVYMCVHIYMYVYISICMCMCIYICICVYIYICIHICICSSFSMYNSFRFIANFSRKLSFRMCVCVCVYICMCVCVYIYVLAYWHKSFWSRKLVNDLLSMPCSEEQEPVSPPASPSHQEASTSLLSSSIRGRREWKPQSQETNQTDHMITALSNSMKLWTILCRATQDRWVMVESLDKTWSTGEGNGKALQYSFLRTSWTIWKDKKIWHWKMNSSGE